MAVSESEPLIARNPANGAKLGRVAATAPEEVASVVARARQAQARWDAAGWSVRREVLRRWWAELAREAKSWAAAITAEVGKPGAEALTEVVATLDALRWTVRHAGRFLADERIGAGWQRWALLGPARLRWRPFGVVGIVGTWNYPLFLNAPPMAHALAAGNAVVWKPSELAPWLGLKLQRSLEDAGLPAGLVAAVHGGPEVGRALVGSDIDKCMFTGGIENGSLVLAELGRRGIPAVAELSGFDPAIVLPDAPRVSTVRALGWAAFVASGQTCIAVKRVYVVGDPLPWAEALAAHARALRVGDPSQGSVNMGPMISEAARDRFDRTIQQAVAAGARILTGGSPLPGNGWFYPPTVLLSETAPPESVLAGCFGPALIVRGVPDLDAAVSACNASRYGLAASVWSRDQRAARALADRLEAGMVGVNEAVTPCAHASAPFGGVKSSGFGRVHGAHGLREFVQTQVVHTRSAGGFRPQLSPDARRLEWLLDLYRWAFHPRR